MKRSAFLIAALLAVTPFASCDAESQSVKVMEAETLDEKTISCKVEGFYEVSDTEKKNDINVNFGGYYNGNNYGVVAVPHSSTSYVPVTNHYVYLRDEKGGIGVFKISSDCYAVMSKLEGKDIKVQYKHSKGVFDIEEQNFSWNGFNLVYQATLDADTQITTEPTTETEGE